jgi:vitamin B12 transporter
MRLRIPFLFFLTVSLLLPCSIFAQTSAAKHGATIRGTVFDPDGRAVPDAQVTLLGAMTVSSQTRSDSHGEYRFEGLAAGEYTIVANVAGFSTISANIKLGSDAELMSDLDLKLSAVQQQVVVSASLGGRHCK